MKYILYFTLSLSLPAFASEPEAQPGDWEQTSYRDFQDHEPSEDDDRPADIYQKDGHKYQDEPTYVSEPWETSADKKPN